MPAPKEHFRDRKLQTAPCRPRTNTRWRKLPANTKGVLQISRRTRRTTADSQQNPILILSSLFGRVGPFASVLLRWRFQH
ncbi:unnamed protein product [Ixodes hexagonus]